ncbi:MAG TPA: V-type ATP synthase subunit E family protein [Oscillospiraceae bacterium]|nr:V-type ATP synthase subunit E family protein [Oscillospiraceae bacterium]
MNGIEKITAHIESDSMEETRLIREEAEKKAAAIRAGYEKAAQDEYNKLVAASQKDSASRLERLGSVAGVDARKTILAAKQEMLDRAFDLALSKLSALPEERYVPLVASLAANASRNGKEEIILSEQDLKRCGDKILAAANRKLAEAGKTAALTLSPKTAPIQGGLILSDGNIEINCTFETLVRLQRGTLAGEAAKVLFA